MNQDGDRSPDPICKVPDRTGHGGRLRAALFGASTRSSHAGSMLAIFCLALLHSGCDDILRATDQRRDQLTYEELTGEEDLEEGPVDNSYFVAMGDHSEALHELSGSLRVTLQEELEIPGGFPVFKVDFFTHEGHLIPAERDIVKATNGEWDILFSPGRVWSEPDDEGWSRASFPFALTSRDWNQSHNGLATFLYDDTTVTDLVVQIVQEAAAGAQFDGWAELSFDYAPGPVRNKETLKANFEREVANRFPVRQWSELGTRLDVEDFRAFDGDAVDITISGLVVDGAFYGQPCRTRYGDYPYCSEMRHGVYSVTKTMGAALSLFWLAQTYGDDVYDLLIEDYLDVTAKHDGWDGVTFEDTLNMVTGVGDRAPDRSSTRYQFEADDEGLLLERFAAAGDAAAKLKMAFSAGNYPWGPGEVGRYNTAQTFVLAAAMDAFLKSQEGPDAHLWDRVFEDVLKPLGIAHAPMMHTREANGRRGIPIMGYGYLPTIGELARLAEFFQNGGEHNGRQVIDDGRLEQIFQNSESVGYPIGWQNEFDRYRYSKSFWFMPFEAEEECFYWIPEMIGFGGNIVQLLPNGMTAIRLADGPKEAEDNPNGETMARTAHRIRSFCD